MTHRTITRILLPVLVVGSVATVAACDPTATVPVVDEITTTMDAPPSGAVPASEDTSPTGTVPAPEVRPIDDDEFEVVNPTSGSALYVRVYPPSDGSVPETAVILVPGGRSDSSLFSGSLAGRASTAQTLADEGYLVVVFDPEGRGRSEGVEDDNGFIGQDGLAAIASWVTGLDGVETVGFATNSYGITLAAGVASRYDVVDFIIDWEGPADRDDTGNCDGGASAESGRPGGGGHLTGHDCSDETWWTQREAALLIEGIDVPYLRLQSVTDHVPSSYDHAVKLLNAALASDSPWVALNMVEVTSEVTSLSAGQMLPDTIDRQTAEMYAEALEVILEHV